MENQTIPIQHPSQSQGIIQPSQGGEGFQNYPIQQPMQPLQAQTENFSPPQTQPLPLQGQQPPSNLHQAHIPQAMGMQPGAYPTQDPTQTYKHGYSQGYPYPPQQQQGYPYQTYPAYPPQHHTSQYPPNKDHLNQDAQIDKSDMAPKKEMSFCMKKTILTIVGVLIFLVILGAFLGFVISKCNADIKPPNEPTGTNF